MKKYFLPSLLVLSGFLQFSPTAWSADFASLCTGHWQGTMHIWAGGALRDSVETELKVNPWGGEADYWSWNLSYKSALNPVVKAYTLHKTKSQPEEYDLDEGDGVILKMFVYGNELVCCYKMDEVFFMCTYLLTGKNLVMSVYSSANINEKSSEAESFSTNYFQRVEFTKIQ